MKKLYTLVLSLSFLGISSLSAQSWGFGQIGHWAQDVAVGSDGNIWAVGSGGDAADWMDVTSNYVVKLSSDGEKLWGHTPAGLPWATATALSVMPTADGGAIVYCTNDVASPALYKLDTDGNLLWETSGLWVGSYYIYGGIACQLNDGRVIIGGLVYEGFFFGIQNQFYEVDASGNLLSAFTTEVDTTDFAWGYWNYKETGLIATSDGGFAYASGNDTHRTLDKFDSDLNSEWNGAYEWMISWEYGYQNNLKQTADGGYLLSGSGSDGGGGYYEGVVRKIASDGTLEWENSYYHGGTTEEGSWALELGADNYIVWTQDAGDNSSAGWVTDAGGTETGSIGIPVINCTWGWGETGMEVWDVESTPDGGYLIAGRQWLEDCDQRMTIIKSNPDGTFDPCIFNCVWPGDANNDGYADADDLFEIGINYGATGFTRDDMGVDWSGKLSRAWMEEDSVYWYILNDLKWTDCNGDGTINDDDTTAVSLNYGLDHPLNTLKTNSGDVPLYFAPDEAVLHVGYNEIPIILGDEISPVDEIYGVSFTIELTGTENVDANSMKVTFNDSWLSTSGTRLSVSKTNAEAKLIFSGLVRKDRSNVGGNGEIGTLSLVVIDNITGKTDADDDATLSFIEAKAIKLNRDEISVETESITFPVESSDNINSAQANGINIYPNPASELLFIENYGALVIDQIEIADITGRILFSGAASTSNQIDVSDMEAGNYFIKIISAGKLITQKITVL